MWCRHLRKLLFPGPRALSLLARRRRRVSSRALGHRASPYRLLLRPSPGWLHPLPLGAATGLMLDWKPVPADLFSGEGLLWKLSALEPLVRFPPDTDPLNGLGKQREHLTEKREVQ